MKASLKKKLDNIQDKVLELITDLELTDGLTDEEEELAGILDQVVELITDALEG